MKDEFSKLCDLDNLCYRISCAIKTVDAVHSAMEYGSSTADAYVDALDGAYYHLYDLQKELRECVNALFEGGRKEKEAQA